MASGNSDDAQRAEMVRHQVAIRNATIKCRNARALSKLKEIVKADKCGKHIRLLPDEQSDIIAFIIDYASKGACDQVRDFLKDHQSAVGNG